MARPAIHPGEILAEELEELGMNASELARALDVPVNRITQILNGQRADETVFRRAAAAAMEGAQGTEHNRFKIELGRRAIVRALTIAANGRSA